MCTESDFYTYIIYTLKDYLLGHFTIKMPMPKI